MKTLGNIAMTIGLTALLGSATLLAQTESIAQIPFDFQIAGKTLPAGKYVVKLATENRMLVFQNVETGRTNVALTHPYKSGIVEEPKLTFLHSGDRYMLQSAWVAGVPGGFGPLPGRKDRADSERGVIATVRLLHK
jgi:hypothetical protein